MEKIYFDYDHENAVGKLVPDHIVLSSAEMALQELDSRGSPYVAIHEEIYGLNYIDCEVYRERFKTLKVEHGASFVNLIAFAVSVTWYAVIRRAYLTKGLVDEGLLANDNSNRLLSSPEGYGETEGYCKSVMEELLGDSPGIYKLAERFGIPLPTYEIVFDALYLYFMSEASTAGDSRHKLLQCLYEAKYALARSYGEYMWEGGCEATSMELQNGESEALSKARKTLARNAAIARHSQGKEVQRQVVERYRKERSLFTNKDEAAIKYAKDFPYEFSTLRGWLKNV